MYCVKNKDKWNLLKTNFQIFTCNMIYSKKNPFLFYFFVFKENKTRIDFRIITKKYKKIIYLFFLGLIYWWMSVVQLIL